MIKGYKLFMRPFLFTVTLYFSRTRVLINKPLRFLKGNRQVTLTFGVVVMTNQMLTLSLIHI